MCVCVSLFKCVLDVRRPQYVLVDLLVCYIVSRVKASWHVRNPHKKLQKSLEHQTTVFFFSFHASFTFILAFWRGFFGCFIRGVWLQTLASLTSQKIEYVLHIDKWNWRLREVAHTQHEIYRNSQQTKHAESISKSRLCRVPHPTCHCPQATYPKLSANCEMCVQIECAKFVTHLQERKRKRGREREWEKSLYS